MAKRRLKAPFPYFGGKGRVASLVWARLGKPRNFIEPFCGSASITLARPDEPAIETLNDFSCFISNFWRAVKGDPDKVAHYADWPVSEVDMHARHLWMMCSETSEEFRLSVKSDPDYYDAKIAGWWVWGQSCWIGSGWCDESRLAEKPTDKRPILGIGNSKHGRGVQAEAKIKLSKQIPELSGDAGASGRGVHQKGVFAKQNGRPQLADAFARGRGVHSNDAASTTEQRQLWLRDWMRRLSDRLRTVRVCCGRWDRVCSSPSVTTRLGTTGIFLDPPYAHDIERMKKWMAHLEGKGEPPGKGDSSNRNNNLYAADKLHDIDRLVAEVQLYCRQRGSDKQMRIVLAGYAGEHDDLCNHGWTQLGWRGSGYSNRTAVGLSNAARETLWYSPHCLDPERGNQQLFSLLKETV